MECELRRLTDHDHHRRQHRHDLFRGGWRTRADRHCQRNLAAAQRILKAIRDRFAQGTASGLDVAQQETLVTNIAVTLPPLERKLEQYKYALAVLVGQAPEFFRYKAEKLFSVAVPVIPSGLPSDLFAAGPT